MSERPDLSWRAIVRPAFSQFRSTTDDPESDFLRYVEDAYRDTKQRAGAVPSAPNLELYVLAVALLTYGRLDVIDDLLDNTPRDRHRYRSQILAGSVSALVPLAPGLDPQQDPQATAVWIREHRDELTWRGEEGRFVLG